MKLEHGQAWRFDGEFDTSLHLSFYIAYVQVIYPKKHCEVESIFQVVGLAAS